MNQVTYTNKKNNMRKVALTALAGTSIEWYDFFLYGAAKSCTCLSQQHFSVKSTKQLL